MTSETLTPDMADYRARSYVYGMRRHGKTGKMEPACGEFAQRFIAHPWVRESVMEGWAKELRTHLVLTVKRRIMCGASYDIVEDLMPPRNWVDYAKHQAARYRAAAEWQKENLPANIGLQYLLKSIAARSGLSYNPETGEIG